MCMVLSCHQIGQSCKDKYFENVENFKYLGTKVTIKFAFLKELDTITCDLNLAVSVITA
jgi:hypothetical protein